MGKNTYLSYQQVPAPAFDGMQGRKEFRLRAHWVGMPASSALLVLALAGSVLCAGCTPDTLGIVLGVKPGQTVDLVTASPSQVVLQYTQSYSWELAAAGRFADRQCGQFGRHATLLSNVPQDVDRSVATFRCE